MTTQIWSCNWARARHPTRFAEYEIQQRLKPLRTVVNSQPSCCISRHQTKSAKLKNKQLKWPRAVQPTAFLTIASYGGLGNMTLVHFFVKRDGKLHGLCPSADRCVAFSLSIFFFVPCWELCFSFSLSCRFYAEKVALREKKRRTWRCSR